MFDLVKKFAFGNLISQQEMLQPKIFRLIMNQIYYLTLTNIN